MTHQPLSLAHLSRPPRSPEGAGIAPPLLVLLHGVGSNERDLFSLADYVDGRFCVVSARAPLTLGPEAFGWYHIAFRPDGTLTYDPAEAERGWNAASRFVDEAVAAYGADPARVVLMGFSQGAIMSLAVALTEPGKAAAVVAMSGRLLPEVVPADGVAGLPILAVHGTADAVLPIHYGREIRDRLEETPVDLTYREYPGMRHEVSNESLSDIAAWLTARLDARR